MNNPKLARAVRLALLGAGALGVAAPAVAQEDEDLEALKEIVVTGTRITEPGTTSDNCYTAKSFGLHRRTSMKSPARRTVTTPMLVALLMLGGGLAAQSNDTSGDQQTVERCRAPEHSQFDFWLGTWEVRDAASELVGHNDIQRVAGGCGLLENWRGVDGMQGMSINSYDSDREKWTQRWVGAGATLWLEGGLEDGRMVLSATAPRNTRRGDVLDRISWTPLADGRVRQLWEISADAGKTWRELFVGYYSAAGDERGPPGVSGAAASGGEDE